jgi:asparagine synthase (glutamine-hydrolysing)
MGALAGVDVRYPLLDRAVLRQSAALPGGAKVHARGLEFITTWPLRKAMEARLPAHLVHRPKRSLPNPLSVWLRTAGADFLRGAVEGVCQDDADLFVPAHVRGLAAAHLAGTANHGLQLWTLTLFHLWRKSLGRSLQSG